MSGLARAARDRPIVKHDGEPKLRRIEPLNLPGLKQADDLGALPRFEWVAPTSLLVDETYQRDLKRQSLAMLKRIVERFAWNRCKPPIVVEVEGGLHVVDGQHTAIAAATLGVEKIPIFIVEAEQQLQRAQAFVGHNRDRIILSAIDMHRAMAAAGDPDALDVDAVCRRAGVRIRQINQSSLVAEGDTMAVGSVRTLVRRRGVLRARQVLEALVKAKRAPIQQCEILAADHVIAERGVSEIEAFTAAVRIEGDAGLAKARAKAAKDRLTVWRAVADLYLTRMGART